MDYKEANRRMYDACARKFEKATRGQFEKYLLGEAQAFMGKLNGNRILDLGCGPGVHSLYFQQRGFAPLCFDISRAMLVLCSEKGLETRLGDIERLPFQDNSFDGVWANASLLHVSKKKIVKVLKRISQILTPNGLLFAGFKEGGGEGYVESDKYPGEKRYFAFYQDTEIRKIIAKAGFSVMRKVRMQAGNAVFLDYTAVNGKG